MNNTHRLHDAAAELAHATSDAYSFNRYGFPAWRACCALLLRRGYNPIEVECIMRSRLTRFASDDARYGRATSKDLARFLDADRGVQDHIDDTVLAQMMDTDAEPIQKFNSRSVLSLAWSRPNA